MMASNTAMDAERFGDVFQELVKDIVGDDESNPEIRDAALRFEKVGQIFILRRRLIMIETTLIKKG